MTYYRTTFSGRIFRTVMRSERFYEIGLAGANALMYLANSELLERLRQVYY